LEQEYPKLVEPAKLILNKCDGLPLVIVTIYRKFLGGAGNKKCCGMEKIECTHYF
jgi:hypothetical protein